MVHEELYNVRDLPRKRGGEKLQKGHYSIIIYIDTQFQLTFIQGEPPQTRNLYIFRSTVIFRLPFKIILTIVQFIKAWFFTLLSTNLLFWAHWVNIPYTFQFRPQIETLQVPCMDIYIVKIGVEIGSQTMWDLFQILVLTQKTFIFYVSRTLHAHAGLSLRVHALWLRTQDDSCVHMLRASLALLF